MQLVEFPNWKSVSIPFLFRLSLSPFFRAGLCLQGARFGGGADQRNLLSCCLSAVTVPVNVPLTSRVPQSGTSLEAGPCQWVAGS